MSVCLSVWLLAGLDLSVLLSVCDDIFVGILGVFLPGRPVYRLVCLFVCQFVCVYLCLFIS